MDGGHVETVRTLLTHPLMPAPSQMHFDMLMHAADPSKADTAASAECLRMIAPFYPPVKVCWRVRGTGGVGEVSHDRVFVYPRPAVLPAAPEPRSAGAVS